MAQLLINAGSGQRPFEKPWINVDLQDKWKPDVVADWRSMPMFDDGSAEMIVAHHTIEHVGCGDAKPFFQEASRILQPGGSLIITVPDLRTLAQRWLTGQINEADRHKWHHTFRSLKEELTRLGTSQVGGAFGDLGELLPRDKRIGFSEVKYFDWRPIQGADIVKDWWILGVEAVK